MDEVRLIDGNALEQEMREFAAQIFVGCNKTTTDCEEAVHTCADMVNEAKTIDPEDLPPCWRKSVEDPPTKVFAIYQSLEYGRVLRRGPAKGCKVLRYTDGHYTSGILKPKPRHK